MNLTGDRRVVERSGELEYARRLILNAGLDEASFTVDVQRPFAMGEDGPETTSGYVVSVTNVKTKRSRRYAGGNGKSWVVAFASDLANRVFTAY